MSSYGYLKRSIRKISHYEFNASDVAPRRLQTHEKYMESLLPEFHRRFLDTYGPNHNIPFFKWRKSFRDHIVRSDNDFSNHLEYIFNNASKHGFLQGLEKWKWMWIETMAR